MSSGGDGPQSTQTSSIPEWLIGPAQGFLGAAGQVATRPFQQYGGPQVAQLSPTTQYGIQGIGNLAGGTPSMWSAEQMLNETLQGGGMNPYMTGVANRVTDDASRAYGQATSANLNRFRGSNRNSSAFENAQNGLDVNFARGLGDALAPVYQSGYENERGRQMQAVGASTGLYGALGQGYQNAIQAGMSEQAYMQQLYNAEQGNFNNWYNSPEQRLGIFGSALGSLLGRTGPSTTTQGPGADPMAQGMGYLMLLNGMFGR